MKRQVKIPEVLFFQEGPGVRNTQYTSSGVKLLNVANLVNGKVDLSTSDRFISNDEAYNKYSHFLCERGDFIVASSGIKVEYIDKKMGFITEEMLPLCMNTSTIRFRSLNHEVLNIRYFMYYLKSQHFKLQLEKHITGSAQLNYGPSHLAKMTIPLVDIYIQDSIVKKLDTLSRVMDYRRAQLTKLDELVKCRFVEMFGNCNRIVPLKEFVWFQEGPGVRSVDFTKNGTILLTGSNINRNVITFGYKNDRFISDELAKGKYSHFMCDEGDILVVSSAIDPNRFDEKVVTVPPNVRYCLNTGIIRFKPNVNYLTTEYFKAFLKTDYFKNQVKSEMRGIAQMHFGPSHLNQMTIILPDSLEQQNSFVSFVQHIDKLRFVVETSHNHKHFTICGLVYLYANLRLNLKFA